MDNLIKRVKCAGCIALKLKDNQFYCELGIIISQRKIGGKAVAPTPTDKCYKPVTAIAMKRIKKLIKDND